MTTITTEQLSMLTIQVARVHTAVKHGEDLKTVLDEPNKEWQTNHELIVRDKGLVLNAFGIDVLLDNLPEPPPDEGNPQPERSVA